jgi:hypothetical protein
MKKHVFSFFLFSFFSFAGFAQAKYPVSAIAPAMLKGAHVVKRLEEISFTLTKLDDAVYNRKVVLTILDEEGQEHADLAVWYDKFRKVSNIEGALYDGSGNLLKKVKGKDISDLSATSSISLYDDNRVKVHDFRYKVFPYTVEYEMEVEYNHSFYFPDWEPQGYEDLAVEQSSFTFTTPDTYTLRYKAFNYKNEPVATTANGKKTQKWEVKNLVALERPFASPAWHELTPTVLFAPTDFQMEGYKGNAASWADFGKFMLTLNQGRDVLPEAVKQKVQSLTAGITDPKEKTVKLYEYMQQNTRYISVQLGIGGFQPFDAAYVAQKGYGDCKALSNYMYSLLKVAGVKSYPALIHAGRSFDAKNLVEDLPSTQFNHMVLFVPLEKDTLWLECTSQDESAGYAGTFTGNRKALAITEEGGKLVNTPRYTTATNLQVRSVKGVVDEEGNLSLVIATRYAAQQQDHYSSLINALSKEKVKKYLNERLDLSTYDVADFAYHAKKDRLPEVDEELKINVAGYATVSGRRLFVVPNVMNRSGSRFTVSEERTCDYVFDMPYTDVDSVEISIPQGYQLEAMPPQMNLQTKYGSYKTAIKLEGNKIFYYRKIERPTGRYPAKEGAEIAKFYEDIYKCDRSRMVLVKKEG